MIRYIFTFCLLLFLGCNKKEDNKTHESISVKEIPDKKESDFLIGIYVAPPKNLTLDIHYKAIADANVNLIQDIYTHNSYTVDDKVNMLVMAEKYGIKMIIADQRMNSDEEGINSLIEDYSKYKSAVGYFIKDEPLVNELEDAAKRYRTVLEKSPFAIPHVNLFPSYATGALGKINYERDYVEKWINLVGKDKLQYLSFDNYPFVDADENKRFNDYFHDLDVIRRLGLKYNVKTSSYLQSIGSSVGIRKPTMNEMRYSAYSNLAYGIKLPVWFTYWTPTGGVEKFTNAIVDEKGQKTILYSSFAKLNKEMMQIGPTLLTLDAKNVYHVGDEIPLNSDLPPQDFYIRIKDSKMNLILTEFWDKENQRLYIMVVNKSVEKEKVIDFYLTIDGSIDEVSKLNGEMIRKKIEESVFQDSYLPGEGKLYFINKS